MASAKASMGSSSLILNIQHSDRPKPLAGAAKKTHTWHEALNAAREYMRCPTTCVETPHLHSLPSRRDHSMSWGDFGPNTNWKYAWELDDQTPRRERQIRKYASLPPPPVQIWPSSGQKFTLLSLLPGELIDKIFLLSMEPYTVTAHVYDNTDEVSGFNGHHAVYGPQIIFSHAYLRKFAHVTLYSINRRSRDLAIRYYGEPKQHSFPFNPHLDTLGLLGSGAKEYPIEGRWAVWPRREGLLMAAAKAWERAVYMDQDVALRVRSVRLDTWFEYPAMPLEERASGSVYGSWHVVLQAIKHNFPNLTCLQLDMVRHDSCYTWHISRPLRPSHIAWYYTEHLRLFNALETAPANSKGGSMSPDEPKYNVDVEAMFPSITRLKIAPYAVECTQANKKWIARRSDRNVLTQRRLDEPEVPFGPVYVGKMYGAPGEEINGWGWSLRAKVRERLVPEEDDDSGTKKTSVEVPAAQEDEEVTSVQGDGGNLTRLLWAMGLEEQDAEQDTVPEEEE
jgi:hypothetical protein